MNTFESIVKKKTDDGRDVVEARERSKKKLILPADILKEMSQIDKSIMHFQEEKERLQNIYDELTK